MSLFDFLFGSEQEVQAPYTSPTAQLLNPYLSNYATGAITSISPSELTSTNQNAYNQYLAQMQGISSGVLPSNYEAQLSAMRDDSINSAVNSINAATQEGVGGLLSGYANRGVINSSVATDGIAQVSDQAYSTLSSAISNANNTYNSNYINGLATLADMASNSLANALGYTSSTQDLALSPALELYAQELSKDPIIKDAQEGLLTGMLKNFSAGLGSGLSKALVG